MMSMLNIAYISNNKKLFNQKEMFLDEEEVFQNLLITKYSTDRYTEDVRRKIANCLLEGGSIQDIMEILKKNMNLREWESRRTAVTEKNNYKTEVKRREYLSNGITHWKWIVTSSKECKSRIDCPSCNKLNGKIVQIGDAFTICRGEAKIKPPLHPNCECDVEAVNK